MPKAHTKTSRNRKQLGVQPFNLPPIDLLAVQKESYQWFIETGIKDLFAEISPIEDYSGKNWTLTFGNYKFDEPQLTVTEALEKDLSYEASLRVNVTLTNKKTGKSFEQEVFAGDIPMMTPRGTFIINGVERGVVNQIVRSPGVYFTGESDASSSRMLYQAEVRPLYGSWFDFAISKNDVISVRIDRRRKFPATVLLRLLGYSSDEEILKLFPNDKRFIPKTIEKDPTKTQEEAYLEIYKKVRPGEPLVLENARERIRTMFFNYRHYNLGEVGRYKVNKRLGLDIPNSSEGWVLNHEDIVKILDYLIKLMNHEGRTDNIDHLANRRVRRVGELVANTAFRTGLLRLERTIKERMSLTGAVADLTPSQLINPKPLMAAINEFFRVSQLSTIIDQTNPLSELDNLRRLTVMGTGGVSRERASFSIRDIHSSQYGRICPVRTPEGPNIGLVTYMTLYARVNEYGFLETPYRVVKNQKVTDEIHYLQADDEERHYVTHAQVKLDGRGKIIEEIVPVRFRGEFLETDSSKVEYIDVSPLQVVGTSASLIPFIAHDEANRALMGTHMQCQGVPLIRPTAPVVGTGMEKIVPQVLGRSVASNVDGKITYVDAREIQITDKEGKKHTFHLEKFKKTSQSTSFSQRPLVYIGDTVKKGDIIIDGPACENGELALGQNLRIAYMALDGLGYEDAIVISERLLYEDLLTSINIEEYETDVVDTKLGPEETTGDIPNVGEGALRNLDKEGVIIIGSEVGPNDILVGKIAPKGETELTAEERLLRAIFGEKAREVRDTSLRMPHGERGIVVGIKILDREKGDELDPGTMRRIIVKVAQLRKVTVGDKLAGRHGNKGVISKIVPVADMPYLPDGTPVDIIISPLSVYNRMNLGQLLEATLGWAGEKMGENYAVPVFESIPEEELFKIYKKAGIPVNGKTVLYDGRTGKPFDREVVYGIGYILKLIHMIEDKTHARSTGPYSLVTQQPLGGKAQMGGQRVGEMEVWTLEAHKAAYTLQEMLTIKSDDVVGRARAFEAIVKGLEIPTPTIPESFKVLVKELESLGLHVQPLGVKDNG
ncbi:MAG: DNA-directed RNA polymerase subunit beta [Microgenomates group bacterium GW2011_GWC1_41_8]|uniref:DNA-directed RNA polymerase subunit beta n=2 Tax=Candidatus Roizmaniibacteriota TaxID=1752723 RepID=A0A0G0TCC5_9BACT|nr:MAG: DNA-directed RNA polymerase subunit beta [Candidatus Levybacteria bacterium GW2011_GWA2_40_16]KKR72481.1 MAG: DNA-directed RNA polymerase subunit beta [Candidatus Roizmanbacteria bacterium GW2011_GWB1_40_7]KKR94816.1 MAG: DNA-directed RNA polymerase subunit beta [Candidatus Roizmanbacteria bacterium GW2011_GWA1_41_13]KKS24095.1 MAG: DNA-directed RNA polymerase subunit beta [Microgenomates group bacterium GW2011_GWC1_41_8]